MIDNLLQRHIPDSFGPNGSLVGVDLVREQFRAVGETCAYVMGTSQFYLPLFAVRDTSAFTRG